MLKGDIETVSVRPCVNPSVRLSEKKVLSQPQFSPILTKFVQYVYISENVYNMNFHKKVAKIVAVAAVFLFKL